jgi:hypothetical protein
VSAPRAKECQAPTVMRHKVQTNVLTGIWFARSAADSMKHKFNRKLVSLVGSCIRQ